MWIRKCVWSGMQYCAYLALSCFVIVRCMSLTSFRSLHWHWGCHVIMWLRIPWLVLNMCPQPGLRSGAAIIRPITTQYWTYLAMPGILWGVYCFLVTIGRVVTPPHWTELHPCCCAVVSNLAHYPLGIFSVNTSKQPCSLATSMISLPIRL